ncbi:MAG: hypothetical protein NC086_00570 [Alistipes sp.]|nr:hypothetical protein [Alistipes sp.]
MPVDKLIKTPARNTNMGREKGTGFEEMKRRMEGICDSLNYSAEVYMPEKTISSINYYIKHYDRILYSEISAYIFSLGEQQRGNFISNVERLLVSGLESEENKKVQDCVLRIYDHVHLAICQIESLRWDKDDELKILFIENLKPIRDRLENQLEEKIQTTQKEIYAQLIALVGIFTAMAFLIFGSISSLDNIFSNFQNISLIKISIVGCVWGLCVLNLISIFIFFVSKMTKLELEKRSYSIIAWANLILIFLLIVSIWYYYIKSVGINEWFDIMAKNNAVLTTVLGFCVILLLFLISILVLVKSFNKKDD